ncbi:MAG: JAB domain-containing protein [Candidatus Rokubacteria bacterium]|nr:JAB domain-containing protein [Candidatus Rokubacteria bacterium]
MCLRWRQRRVPAGAPALGAVVSSSSDIARLFAFLKSEPREHLYAVHIDAGNRVIGLELLGMGGLTHAPCPIADLFRAALLSGAAGILLVHQHPSGRAHPSLADIQLTDQVARAGKLLGVGLLDHVIIGARGHYSFSDRGTLPR